MTDPYAKGTEKDKWPGQEKAAPIGYPHPGFHADNSDKKAFITPTFDGGYMESPGKGLGQGNEGNFPSDTWLPEGQANKSVNEDEQLGYPGTAEAPRQNNLQQYIEKAFGKEYREAFDQLANALREHESLQESISIIIKNSDYALDPTILQQLAEKYLK